MKPLNRNKKVNGKVYGLEFSKYLDVDELVKADGDGGVVVVM